VERCENGSDMWTVEVDSGGGNGAGCFEVEVWADTTKFTTVLVAGFRKCRDLV